jgi:formylglycine-generating enzyme required for sulfatase activity
MNHALPRSIAPLLLILLAPMLTPGSPLTPPRDPSLPGDLIAIPGGAFRMGDLFAEGRDNELPVHQVQVADFLLGRCEVTVGQYREFVAATGYLTRAERFDSRQRQQARFDTLMAKMRRGEHDEEFRELSRQLLESGGCFYWISAPPSFGFSLDCNWRTPLIEQTDQDPVVGLAWVDAACYCNWLSHQVGLPPAYRMDSGELLDGAGTPTCDITAVKGYRLPTEAEWEYAAREGGAQVRFGNGCDLARSSEMNFRPVGGQEPYCEEGEYRARTTPVGSLRANRLGLHDMSGNAWEWCTDYYQDYSTEDQVNPVGVNGKHRVLRGGRWGGSAAEARVSARSPYEQINRCNNAGFRLARSR